MKIAKLLGATLLVFGLGITLPASAQRDRDDDHGYRGRGHEERGGHDRRDGRREVRDDRGPRHDERAERREERHEDQRWGREDRGREHARFERVDRHEREHDFDHGRPRDIWQRDRAEHWEREHHNWRERGGYRGYRIPDDRFRAHFGRGHWFRVHSVPVIVVERYPRFQYAGFWFTLVDPWPETWSERWYETDDVYIDYIHDGYYMCNRRHPGVFIAVNVSM